MTFLSKKPVTVAALVLRVVLGVIFVYAAWVKLREPWALFAMSIDSYQVLPLWAVEQVARVLPWFELLLAVVYKLRALDCGRELPGIEPSSVIPLTVNNLEAKSAYRSRRFYPALMYDLDMRVALTPLSGPVPYAGVGVSAQ
jgi:hypothetical protein